MKFLVVALLILGSILVPVSAEDKPRPMPTPAKAEQDLNQALKLQHYKLVGIVRGKKNTYRVNIVTSDWTMTYTLPGANLKYLVTLGPDSKSVQQLSPGPEHTLSAEEMKKHILDTDITFEDLALVFTLWPCQGDIGADSLKTLPAWVFTVNRSGTSNYAKAKLWVSSQFHGLIRADAYDGDGNVVKRLEVNDVMQSADGTYTLKELMINSMIPGRNLSASQTFIDVDSAEKLP